MFKGNSIMSGANSIMFKVIQFQQIVVSVRDERVSDTHRVAGA
jgi:hypothetical protein